MKRVLLGVIFLAMVVPSKAWWGSSNELSSGEIKELLREVMKQQEALRDRVSYLEGSAGGLLKRAWMIGKRNFSLVSQYALEYLQYASENKASTCALLCGIGCGYISLRIAYLDVMLTRPQLWSAWRKEQELSNLTGDAAMELARELIKDIQMRYLDVSNVTDVIGPVRQFMIVADREIEQLREYAKLAHFMEKLQLSFMINQTLVSSVDKRLHRLELLKTLCLEWLADVKCKLAVGMTSTFQQRVNRYVASKNVQEKANISAA